MNTERLARLGTDALAPAVLATLMPVTVALYAAPTVLQGLGWGLLAALFSAGIPFGLILWGVYRGKLTDRHVGRREQRSGKHILLGLASVAASIPTELVLGAPQQLVAMSSVMTAVLLTVIAINLKWKLSAHAAVAAGSTVVLTVLFGPWWLATLAAVGFVSWSRVRLKDHTTAQVAVGAITGAGVSLAVWALVS